MIDNVWLGLSRKDTNGSFEWNDGSEMVFSNWASQTLPDEQHNCVQMESGDGAFDTGLWFRVNCKRRNAVVCERTPTWTMEMLQNAFLKLKLEQEMKQKEWEEKQNDWEQRYMKSQLEIIELRQRDQQFGQEINALNEKTVPVGFIYVQLPGQLSPADLWPTMQWSDVSSNFSGLFFRVVGGLAAPFGQVQEANSTCLEEVNVKRGELTLPDKVPVPFDGSWSRFVDSGGPTGANKNGIQFRLSTSEIRPRNQAVKIWQRLQ